MRVCARPKGAGFAIAYFSAPRVEWYDKTGQLAGEAAVPYTAPLVWKPGKTNPGISLVVDRMWYKDCAATAGHLYALFSGRGRQFKGEEQSSGEFIHVFDWSGKLVKVYKLDRPVFSISVDQNEQFMYTSSMLDASVYKYALRQ
jgi:hypothetical protein